MTQTVHRINGNTVSVYYHPNNPKPKRNDQRLRWKYDIIMQQVQVSEVIQNIFDNSDDGKLNESEIEMIKYIAETARNGRIWEVIAGSSMGNGCKDLGLSFKDMYHATRAEAISIALNQNC